ICASMGFAFVMKYILCDKHLVALLTKPLRNAEFILIPVTTVLNYFINIAIPSAAGCSAAVGSTLIPFLMALDVSPAMAGAAVFAGSFGGVLSPGSAHNIYVADFVKKTVEGYTVHDIIKVHIPSAFTALAIVVVILTIVAILF
uniref:C4-dicarboxylate transporter DcuC n=1 Tax=Campylobacter concisus TaxID=199 RepID=UPI0015E1865F